MLASTDTATNSKFPLVQYWDRKSPPDEVARLMTSWEVDPVYTYRRFDRQMADAFIEEHFDRATLAAFRRCAVPAMQADFFRYCALIVQGGIYVDADSENGGSLIGMIERFASSRGALMTRNNNIANDFLFFCEPRDSLLLKVLEIAIDNVRTEISRNVWQVTGPGIMTGLYRNEDTRFFFEDLPIIPVVEVRKHVLFRFDLEYRKGASDWRNALTSGDIFNRDLQ